MLKVVSLALAHGLGSLLVTALVFFGLRSLDVMQIPETEHASKTLAELATRVFLVVLVAPPTLLFALRHGRPLRTWFARSGVQAGAWFVYVIGAMCALADPVHPVSAEANWIRLCTSLVLLAAGTLFLVATRSTFRGALERTGAFVLGVLLLAAAIDEQFALHEQLSSSPDSAGLVAEARIQAQDLPTLTLALVGLIGVSVVALIGRSRRVDWLQSDRVRVPLQYVVIAALVFACAMLLDSFDWVAAGAARSVRSSVASFAPSLDDAYWTSVLDVERWMNSLEELLEYLAAVFFLTAARRARS